MDGDFDKDKMLVLFYKVHGEITGHCYVEVHDDTVCVMKDGNLCWSSTVTELLFEYITEDF